MGLSVSSVGGQLLFIEATKTVPWPSRRVWLAVNTAIAYLDGQNPPVGVTTQEIFLGYLGTPIGAGFVEILRFVG